MSAGISMLWTIYADSGMDKMLDEDDLEQIEKTIIEEESYEDDDIDDFEDELLMSELDKYLMR